MLMTVWCHIEETGSVVQDRRHDGDEGAVRLARLVPVALADGVGSVVGVPVYGP